MRSSKLITFIILSLTLILIGKIYYDSNTIEIRHYQIQNSSLAEVLGGIKVAFLSDLHIKNIGLREKQVLEIIREEKPDLILLGGDYINFRGPYQPAISFFQQLHATHGIYAVMGNTEYSNENGSCVLCHQEKSKKIKDRPNPTFMRNSAIPLKLNGKVLNLIGLDDPVAKKGDWTAALKHCKPKNPSLLLSHSPEVFKEATQKDIDFILCGHNHGGQFFLIKHLQKILHLDLVIEFLEGFYQKEKTLMYVSRGVGTSFLPFRLGVKPEITFFTFSNGLGSSKDSFKITNSPSKTNFAGLSFYSFLDLFDFFPARSLMEIHNSDLQHPTPNTQHPNESLGLTPNASNELSSGASSPDLTPYTSNPKPNDYRPSPHNVLFDFESDADLEKLNWECHKWFERSPEHATSGQYSLRVILPPGQYPGFRLRNMSKDWSHSTFFKMDIFNSSQENITFHIRIDDHKSGWEYANRFDQNFDLQPGMNHISVPTQTMQTNRRSRSLDLKGIERLIYFIPKNSKKREIYVDHIRLE